MIDNRVITPPGCAQTGDGEILMWIDRENVRSLPIPYFRKNIPGGTFGLCPDFMVRDPDKDVPDNFVSHVRYRKFIENHESNSERIKSFEFDQVESVIIVGGGPRIPTIISDVEKYRGKVTIISVSRGQVHIPGDYWVGVDAIFNPDIEDADFSGTIAHLMTTSNKEIANLPWKKITFGKYGFMDGPEFVPSYFQHENVTCTALEFAIKTLGAKKIAMVGIEHPFASIYYWYGIELAAMSWHASRHGIAVWNCTPSSTVTTGCVLGTLSEAMGD